MKEFNYIRFVVAALVASMSLAHSQSDAEKNARFKLILRKAQRNQKNVVITPHLRVHLVVGCGDRN